MSAVVVFKKAKKVKRQEKATRERFSHSLESGQEKNLLYPVTHHENVGSGPPSKAARFTAHFKKRRRPAHLDVGSGVDFVHGIARSPARLAVQVVALYKDGEVGEAAYPHVALPNNVQLHSLADVEARLLRLLRSAMRNAR